MKIFRSPYPPSQLDPCALTIGNFDGVHLGHQALVRQLVDDARAAGLQATVLSFEPHPREYFCRLAESRGQPAPVSPVRISTLRDRLAMLQSLGVDQVCLARFNPAFAQCSAEDFVSQILAQGLKARHIRIGTDFRYGAHRHGDFASLKAVGRQHGIEVHAMPTIEDKGVRISSSLVREALALSDFGWAASMLGRPYRLSGRVCHGRKLGSRIGFPTLNLRFPYGRPALQGVFVVAVHGLAPEPLPGVANFGTRPAIEQGGAYLLEVHLLDWQGDAYGKLVQVEFLHKLRNEQDFPDIDTLTRQIHADAEAARAYFQPSTQR